MSTYSVVHFVKDNSVEAVPSSWVKAGRKPGSKNYCAWPYNKACISKYIQNKHMPNEIDFEYFRVRVLKKNIESLTKARSISNDARYCSDFTNEEDDLLNYNSRNKNISSPTSSTSSMPVYDIEKTGDGDQDIPLKVTTHSKEKPQPGWSPLKPSSSTKLEEKNKVIRKLTYFEKTTPTTIKKNDLTTSCTSVSKNTNLSVHHANKSSDDQHVSRQNMAVGDHTSLRFNSLPDTEFQSHINKNLAFLKVELRQIQSNQIIMLERLETLQSRLDNQPHALNIALQRNTLNDSALPIDNAIDLQTFEDKIAGDGDFRTCLVMELSYIGGKHVKAMVRRVMSKLCADELLQHYSYNGRKGKIPFCSLNICSVIFDAVKKQPKFKNTSMDEVEETIKYALVQAPFTLQRQQKIINKNTCHD